MNVFNKYLWTSFGYRLNLYQTNLKLPIHWLFLPGGPGLGSEYFQDLVEYLNLPGIVWLVDFPGDGSNRSNKYPVEPNWVEGFINLVHTLQPCIVVTHSFSGMFALSVPEIEKYLNGFVIMNSALDHRWFSQRQDILHQVNPDIDIVRNAYIQNKNDENFKKLTLASINLFFTNNEVEKGKKLLENLPYNFYYYDWIQNHFHPEFSYKWVPKKIPTLIIGSENDALCPISFFQNEIAFKRNNIEIHCVPNAGHFPWVSAPNNIKTLFDNYIQSNFKIQESQIL